MPGRRKSSVENRVKDFREARGMTQSDLAAESGVSRQSIISIERGHYVPSLQLALRIARVFGCATDDLFALKEER